METYSAVGEGRNLANSTRILKEQVSLCARYEYGLNQCLLENTKQAFRVTEKNVPLNTATDSRKTVESEEDIKCNSFCKGDIVLCRQRSLSFPTVGRNSTRSSSFWKEGKLRPSCVRRKDDSKSIHYKFLKISCQDEIIACLNPAMKETVLAQSSSLNDWTLAEEHCFVSRALTSGGGNVINEETNRLITRRSTFSEQQAQKRKTLYLLDWDNTLFPSTALASFESLDSLSDELKVSLNNIEQTLILLLKELNTTGFVAIVTNANFDWVEISCRSFMPKLILLLQELEILVVSARKSFGCDSAFPISNCPSDWKAAAFLKLMIHFFSQTATENYEILKLNELKFSDRLVRPENKGGRPPVYMPRIGNQAIWLKAIHGLERLHEENQKERRDMFDSLELSQMNWKFEKAVLLDNNSFVCHHIIAMGDSNFEYNAINTLREQYPLAYFKFIHFVPEPSIMTLLFELKSVHSALNEMNSFAGNLDIVFNGASD